MQTLSQFKKEQKQENKNKIFKDIQDAAKIYGGASLGLTGLRSGIPRALGVRLESHSTNKKAAKEILKNGGYIDLDKSGELTGSVMPDYGRKLWFVTGKHSADKTPGELGLLLKSSLRKLFRGQSSMPKDELEDLLKYNMYKKVGTLKAQADNTPKEMKDKLLYQYQKAFPNVKIEKFEDIYDNPVKLWREYQRTKKQDIDTEGLEKKLKNKVSNPFTGRSLYIGGGDEFFKNNFIPDVDMPGLAMATDKRLKLSGNRASATIEAIKREGLGNLMSKNKGRVAAGLGILGGTGYLGTKLIKSGIEGIKNRRKYEKKNTNYWNNKINQIR